MTRSRMIRQLLTLAGCAAAAAGLSACGGGSSTGATIAYERPAEPLDTLKPGAFNRELHVRDLAMLFGSGSTAAFAIKIYDVRRLQTNVPVLVHTTGPEHEVLYSNGAGQQLHSVQYISLLRPGHDAWWVDDTIPQRLARSKNTSVQVGTGSTPPPSSSIPDVIATNVRLHTRGGGVYAVSGNLVNHSTTAASSVAVYAVSVAYERRPASIPGPRIAEYIVAAGRTVVESVPHSPPVPFELTLIGSPGHGHLEVTVTPSIP